ncbi:UcrQ-domain-containing protein [Teratosphaeria nubilosa]|uniref:Cytochrome b-c1 complex subunit 8 n=1 Tax=Teratosphaeria nubilosa TaxID=161662 RepID=A0A6G1LKD5_9PEZI|nr:UcrQ-domain-containing protein [Teratosphaeria nubilosa]
MKAGMEYDENLDKDELPVLCWGHKNLPKQKGLVTYQMAATRHRIGKHFWEPTGPFNTVRRTRNQFLYVVPPLLIAYLAMQWAEERNRYLNSKAGRKEFAGQEE